MSTPKLSFRYRLEQEKPRLGPGGITRGASVHEFPASVGIAGVSMRLEAGGMRELHWHANAAEWGYVISGSCRTTILHPDGTHASDDFYPGDCWYFPRGWGHVIQGLGPEECHFILIFDNGNFSEDHTFSISDWMSRTPPAILAQSLGLSADEVAQLPKSEVYFAKGPVVTSSTPQSTARKDPELVAKHRYPLGAQEPRRVPGGGVQRTVTVDEFPISKTMAGSLLELEPGGLRELHWHPGADEWQYYIQGTAEMSVFLAQGNVVTEQFEAGDVGYAPMGSGHYIKNTGSGVLKVLIGFNNPRYESNDLSAWLSTNPNDILATNLGIPEALAKKLPKESHFFIPGPKPR